MTSAGTVMVIVWIIAAGLVGAALVALVRAWRRHSPLARLATALAVAGGVALGASLLIGWLGLAVGPTPRFYHGMLTGIGIGALLGALFLAALDRRG